MTEHAVADGPEPASKITPGNRATGTCRARRPATAPRAAAPLDGIPRQPAPVPGRPRDRRPAATLRRLLRLVPTPTGTPFTFGYGVVLAVTSYVAAHADPALVHTLHQGSSTDVAHLLHAPVFVLVASALWVAGALTSPFSLAFLVVLTALERRLGGVRTALVFLLGHVLATLATEVPVGLAVLVGHLPDTSLHRLDYGISFGVAASVGALAGLLTPWLRWPLLAGCAAALLPDLLAAVDPLTSWGHLIALTVGVGTWPWVRRWAGVTPTGARRTGGAVPAV
ncbi:MULTISPECIES: rhomboid-like protein [unclassified Streptomyces]|uniref:rhomboid-like protein n=1 Tax=unclassified Streptomyces TaxID=2593676 RepID=UPI0037F3B30A